MRKIFLFFIAVMLTALPGLAMGSQGAASYKEQVVVEIQTNKGLIVVELNAEKAPETVANFKSYVEEGFFDGTVFHRVIPEFMIQGGGLTEDLKDKRTRAGIKNEADNGLANVKYSIAMARTNDPHSATSQFFINTKDNAFLNFQAGPPKNWGYCVFGKVIEGTEVVDEIEKVTTQTVGYHENVPVEPVTIEKVTIRN